MRWRKIGKIFDTEKYGLLYAKSPQAVVFDDFIRVYFSTCEKDNDKLISQIRYVDFDNNFNRILQVSKHNVIERGELGCFDEHGIFPFSPIRIDDKIYAYTTGVTRRISVSIESSIGIAFSCDGGNNFKRLGNGPILSSSLNEPFLVCDGYVKKYNDIFHMWYIFGLKWIKIAGKPERVYKISHAVSRDGIEWKRESHQIINDVLGEDECQALPTVIDINGKYHMFFCYRKSYDFKTNRDYTYRIGYAISEDLLIWHRYDEKLGLSFNQNSNEWDSQMMCYPNVFHTENNIYMLYNGNEFGKYGFGLAVMEEID